MTRRSNWFALIGLALAAPGALSAQNADRQPSPEVMQAVKSAFPTELRRAGEPPSGDDSPENPDTCASVFSRKQNGTPDLVVASYRDKGVEVAMLAYQPGGAHVIDAVTNREVSLDGNYCQISIVDLADPDHSAPLLVNTIAISYGGQDWYFTWDSGKLRSITPLMPRGGAIGDEILPDSSMHSTYIADIDHRGAMQIVGNHGDNDNFPQDDGIASTGTDILFRYNGKTYVPAKAILYLREYRSQPSNWDERRDGPWAVGNDGSIKMHRAPASSYQLKIVNGDRDGSNRVTSAKVEINGETVVSPTQVNQGVETLTETIQLQKQNTIKVTVDGPAKSHMYVVVE